MRTAGIDASVAAAADAFIGVFFNRAIARVNLDRCGRHIVM
jgi:hypothetical protein